MKTTRYMKVVLCICIIGALCAVAGYIWAGGTPRSLVKAWNKMDSRNRFTQSVYETDEPVTALHISDEIYGITITASDDGATRVTYTESEHETYEISLEDGELRVEYKADTPWYDFFSISFKEEDRTLLIEAPADALTACTAACTSGELLVDGIHMDGDLHASTVNGSVRIANIVTEGSLTATNVNSGITIKDATVRGGLAASTTNGSVGLTRCNVSGTLETSSINGRLEMRSVRAGDMLRAETVNGSVLLQDADGGSLDLRCVNGDITAALARKEADYAENRDAAEGQSPLHTKTLNGSITITYAD